MNAKTEATVKPRTSDLELTEAIASVGASPLRDDGTVDIHIIRPGLGLGRGRHYYSRDMLQENADVFKGWRVYVDHLSPEAKKAQGGLPRSMNDLGGMIEEAWWDESIPADGRHEAGAVMGRLRPIRTLRETIEQLPQAVQFSIKAKATDVNQDIVEGKPAWVVEGIRQSPGSVDAVTEAGAGGKIADLIEGMDPDRALQEAADLGLLETDESETPDDGTEEGDTVATLEEALRDPDSLVSRAVTARAKAAAEEIIEARDEDIEAKIEEARESGRTEIKGEVAKRDMREEAHRIIEEAKLPDTAAEKLKDRYGLEEATLDLTDEVDDEGEVTKSAMAQLRESLERDIAETREIISEVSPTKVTGQGAGEADEGTATPAKKEDSFWREHMQESGFDETDALYATELQS